MESCTCRQRFLFASVALLSVSFLGCTLRSLDELGSEHSEARSERHVPGCTGPGWCQLSGTRLRDVCPGNESVYGDCRQIVDRHNSAVADLARNRLVIWGGAWSGASSAYWGNELYALDLTTAKLARLNSPSPLDANHCVTDENPNTRDTFDTMAYMTKADRMFVFGGDQACAAGSAQETWTLEMDTLEWHLMPPTGGPPEVSGSRIVVDYDPVTGSVFLATSGGLWKYDYDLSTNTGAYQKLGTAGIQRSATGRVDPVRHKFVVIGNDQAVAFDIDPEGVYSHEDWSTEQSGCDALISASYPGLAFDSRVERFVAWPSGGTVIYELDPESWTCTARMEPSGPGNAEGGMLGRFRYFPDFDVFTAVVDADQDAFVLKLAR